MTYLHGDEAGCSPSTATPRDAELSATSPGGVYLGQRLRFVAGRYWNDPPEQSPTEQAALDASTRRLKILYDHVQSHL